MTHIDFITFQFNRYGGSFIVELTTYPVEGVVNCFGAEIPFNKLTAHDINERFRLTPKDEATQWFDYEMCVAEEQFETIAYCVKHLLSIHEPNWIKQCLSS